MIRDQLEREVRALGSLAERFDRTAGHPLKSAFCAISLDVLGARIPLVLPGTLGAVVVVA